MCNADAHYGRPSMGRKYVMLKFSCPGTSLAVQWLRLHLPMQRVWVRSLIRELRSHMLRGQKTKT